MYKLNKTKHQLLICAVPGFTVIHWLTNGWEHIYYIHSCSGSLSTGLESKLVLLFSFRSPNSGPETAKTQIFL